MIFVKDSTKSKVSDVYNEMYKKGNGVVNHSDLKDNVVYISKSDNNLYLIGWNTFSLRTSGEDNLIKIIDFFKRKGD